MPNLSYAICVCNELDEIQALLNQLFKYITRDDEIIVQFDTQNGTPEVRDYLEKMGMETKLRGIDFHRIFYSLNNDFASFKNHLIEHCTKKWIFQLDADELCHENLLENIHHMLNVNSTDLIVLPRENYTSGLTIGDITKWGWFVDDKGRNNYPDYQQRIFLNKPEIRYINKVHEKLTGYKSITQIPHNIEGWCLIHNKTIERQRKQNEFYETL